MRASKITNVGLQIAPITFGSHEYKLELALREKVLRAPLGLTLSADDTRAEDQDFHWGAFSAGNLVGGGGLGPLGDNLKMRQFAMVPPWQAMGFGSNLVQAVELAGQASGATELYLHSRDSAVPFYTALGYELYDTPFVEVGLPHRKMKKTLQQGA